MNLIEFIKQMGTIPNKMKFENGIAIELFIRKLTNNKGYIASLWEMKDNVQISMVASGSGKTVELAKEKLTKEILSVVL